MEIHGALAGKAGPNQLSDTYIFIYFQIFFHMDHFNEFINFHNFRFVGNFSNKVSDQVLPAFENLMVSLFNLLIYL